mgnify:CR=1 FL=1
MCTEWKSAVYEDALGSPGRVISLQRKIADVRTKHNVIAERRKQEKQNVIAECRKQEKQEQKWRGLS